MALKSILAVCLALALAAAPASARPELEKTEITWMVSGLPLLYTPEERERTATFNNRQLDYLIDHLGVFDHKILSGSLTRNLYMMEHYDGFCVESAMRSPDREKFMRFSSRPLPYPGFRVVVRSQHLAELAPYIDMSGAIDLKKLAGAAGIKGGFNSSRIYPDAIRNFIDSDRRAVPMEKIMSTRQMFNLIHEDRLLFGFALPIEVTFIQTIPDAPFKEFVTLPVAGAPDHVDGYVACSNGPIGSAAIKAIDQLLENEARWSEFVAPLQPWLPPDDFAAARREWR